MSMGRPSKTCEKPLIGGSASAAAQPPIRTGTNIEATRGDAPALISAAPRPALSAPADFSESQLGDLRRLGVTSAQVKHLRARLRTVSVALRGDAPIEAVRDRLREMLDHLEAAERLMTTLRVSREPVDREARSYLAAGASDFDCAEAVADIDTATEGTVPDPIDVPTLLRLLTTTARLALEVHTPKDDQRRAEAPWRAVHQIVVAMGRPTDETSRLAAHKLKPVLTRDGPFFELCSLVFDATGVEPARATNSRSAGIRGDVERAVRAYLKRVTLAA